MPIIHPVNQDMIKLSLSRHFPFLLQYLTLSVDVKTYQNHHQGQD